MSSNWKIIAQDWHHYSITAEKVSHSSTRCETTSSFKTWARVEKNNWDTQKNFVWNLFDVQEWKKRLICKKEELQMFAIYFFSHSAAT